MKFFIPLFISAMVVWSSQGTASDVSPTTDREIMTSTNPNAARQFFPHGMAALQKMKQGESQKVWLSSFNALMEFALKSLREKGYNEIADQREMEWQFYSMQLAQGPLNTMDLGDHRPLCDWLGAFYEELENLLTKRFCEFFHLDDIKAFNYGYVVTFYPNGDPVTRETWDKLEYKKHFVPFATASFYWSAYIACNVMAPGLASLGCSIGLMGPRYFVKRWVAPPIAGHVYQQSRLNNK